MSGEANPLVTVIIPFFNGEQFIREAIESVFTQTYQNWELLLVDDGSTDASTQIAREYERRCPAQVRYLEHEAHRNLGQSSARNLGMRNANGQFFAFLDCDDVWLPPKLARQVAILLSHPEAGMVFGAAEYWRSWDQRQSDANDYTPDLGVSPNGLFRPPELLLLLHPLGIGTAPCPSDLMIRSAVFSSTGGFPEEYHGMYSMYEDQVFLAKVYLRETVFVSSETWIRYRVHAGSCMSTVREASKEADVRLFFLTHLDDYLVRHTIDDPRIWGLLHRALLPYGRSISRLGIEGAYTREVIWQLRIAAGNTARLKFPDDDLLAVRVEIEHAQAGDEWNIQLNQPDLVVREGQSYRLEFRVRADSPRQLSVGFSRAHDPWNNLGLYQRIEATTEWTDCRFEFEAKADDENARIHFDVGGSATSVVVSGVVLYGTSDGRCIEPGIVQAHYPAERWKDSATISGALRFSIVIPTFQRRDLVLVAVRSVANQRFSSEFEIIVVVDGSTDGTADALRELRISAPLTVIEQSNCGLAAARNAGAAVAHGDVLLFLDDDMEAHPRMLSEHQRSYSEGADAVLGHFPLHPKSPKNFLTAGVESWVEERRRRLSELQSEFPLHDIAFGQASVKRTWFERSGGFDAILTAGGSWGNEDTDFGHRLLASGCRILFNPYALSYQNYVISPRKFLRQIRQRGRGDVILPRKHRDRTGVLFAPRFHGRLWKAMAWRAMVALRPFTTPAMAILRSLALRLVEQANPGPRATAFFYEIFEMEYWTGVREGGGMPRLDSVRVLCYHALRDLRGDAKLEDYGMPPRNFRRQMTALRTLGFHFVGAEDFLQFLNGRTKLPPRAVLLTFDDCYDDLLAYGLPLLRRMQIPALVFAVTARLGESNLWDQADGARPLKLLDVSGLQTLEQNGVEIGAHSRTHRPLTGIPQSELAAEVGGSAKDLAEAGLKQARSFAYPYGDWDFKVRSAVRDAGLQAAFTVDYGCVRRGEDRYLIPRIQVLRKDTGWRFLWKVIAAG